mmetsp:Transcript_18384/g.24905  ORF Transcript_18384/g.24905 Transcript_18384/m.24905 type:complete len:86 (-) Transcript_18384:161-418(-)
MEISAIAISPGLIILPRLLSNVHERTQGKAASKPILKRRTTTPALPRNHRAGHSDINVFDLAHLALLRSIVALGGISLAGKPTAV